MPSPGSIKTEIRASASPEERTCAELLQQLCTMCRNVLPSQRAVARKILVAPSALSDFLHGVKVPSEDAVERLWEAALGSKSAKVASLPPLEHVLRVRLQADLSRRGLSDSAVVSRAARVQARLLRGGRIPPPTGLDADDAMRHLQAWPGLRGVHALLEHRTGA